MNNTEISEAKIIEEKLLSFDDVNVCVTTILTSWMKCIKHTLNSSSWRLSSNLSITTEKKWLIIKQNSRPQEMCDTFIRSINFLYVHCDIWKKCDKSLSCLSMKTHIWCCLRQCLHSECISPNFDKHTDKHCLHSLVICSRTFFSQ